MFKLSLLTIAFLALGVGCGGVNPGTADGGSSADGGTSADGGANCSVDVAVGCNGVAPAKLSDIQATIFRVGCATNGCHSSTGTAPGDLSSTQAAYQGLVNVAANSPACAKRVVPMHPEISDLMKRIGTASGGSCQSGPSPLCMPNNQTPLSQQDQDMIRGWICAGAPNN